MDLRLTDTDMVGPTERRGPSEPLPPLCLIVLTDAGATRHVLPSAGAVTIGRSEHARVRIVHKSISREHAILHVGDRLLLEDRDSANGTRVRGQPLAPRQTVEVGRGDVIDVGGVCLVLEHLADRGARVDRPAIGAPISERDRLLSRVAESEISVLITGETGVGKEVLADALHRQSRRAGRPLLKLNCGAFPESLLESELFGHEKGAFTGADRTKPGLLETAEGGTVFLDEVGELPGSTQVRLLRVVEERMVMRLGGMSPRPIDVRFVAATNRDLELEVERGTFRRDLYFRLNGITLVIPPLRERAEEIPELANRLLAEACEREGRHRPSLSSTALLLLTSHAWPGNVRELRNVIDRALVLCPGDDIGPEHLSLGKMSLAATDPGSPDAAPLRRDVDSYERRRIVDVLDRCAGNQSKAAKLLGISRRTLVARLSSYGLTRPRNR